MNSQDLAALLNGRQYRKEITTEEARQAEQAGLVVVYGASDDLVEFDGGIYDEIGGWAKLGIVVYAHNNYYCATRISEIQEIANARKQVAALDSTERGNIIVAYGPGRKEQTPVACQWYITTELPHAPFDIMDGEELFCQGLVFNISDLNS